MEHSFANISVLWFTFSCLLISLNYRHLSSSIVLKYSSVNFPVMFVLRYLFSMIFSIYLTAFFVCVMSRIINNKDLV